MAVRFHQCEYGKFSIGDVFLVISRASGTTLYTDIIHFGL